MSDAPPQRRARAQGIGTLGGFIATAIVVALCVVVMINWDAGLSGDLLLGAAALGVLFRMPHTVPVWAALTLLVATAIALSFNGEALASRFADLAYYGLAVGCLWAIWDMTLERLRWRLPGNALHEWLLRTPAYLYGAAVLLGAGALAVVAFDSYLIGLAGLLLGAVAISGVLLSYRSLAAFWGSGTLVLITAVLAVSGYPVVALATGLLAAGAFLMALLWARWQMLIVEHGLARRVMRHPGSADVATTDGPQAPGNDRNTVNV